MNLSFLTFARISGNIAHLTFVMVALFLVGCTFETAGSASPARSAQNPNIILLLTDDQGYADVGVYGATGFETPTLDKLATEGVRFTQYYAAQPYCSASRAGLLTGVYPNRIGISGALGPEAIIGINQDETTIAEMLKKVGYSTAMIGKWHLGHHEKFLPLQHGFDYYYGLPYSNDMWPLSHLGEPLKQGDSRANFPPLPIIEGNEIIGEVNSLAEQSTLTRDYTHKAISFIRGHSQSPFFLYLAYTMPHVPIKASNKFAGRSSSGAYGDVIMEIDWSVAELIETLENEGIADNTIFIFTSDNGPSLHFGNHAGSAWPLREGKTTSFEGGVRVPLIIKWPGVTPEGTVIDDKMASAIDIYPTIADIVGVEIPEGAIDGVSILPLLRGESRKNPRRVLYYYSGTNDLQALRVGDWKLIFRHYYRKAATTGMNGRPGERKVVLAESALYNLKSDPGETVDLQHLHPGVVAEMNTIARIAREDLGDRLIGAPGKGRRPPGRL